MKVGFFILAFICLFNTGFSQISKSISLGANGSRGNFSSIGVTIRTELSKDTGRFNWSINPTYRWSEQSRPGESNMTMYESELYLASNLSRRIGKWKITAFTESERSYMRKIDLRGSLGVGVGYDLIKSKELNLTISEIILPEYYWSAVNNVNDNFTVRSSTRLKLEIQKNSFKFNSMTLYQPAIFTNREVGYLDNLNVRSTNSITMVVSKGLEIGLLYVYSYEGYPAFVNQRVSPTQENISIMIKAIL